jgi:predicted HAD superfamily Cof-like phosphohydrolase
MSDHPQLDVYTPYDDVREFHAAFGHPIGEAPNPLDPDLIAKRLKWMREELDEFELWASRVGDPAWDQDEVLAEMYDAMIDENYFVYGTLVAMKLRPEPGFTRVHQANMAKLHYVDGDLIAVYDEDGKVVKPEGWVAPSHVQMIRDLRGDAQ